MSDISIAIILVVAAVALVWLFLRYKAKASERRMLQMMQRYGLSPELIAQGDTGAIIKEIRSRCQRCQAEGPCEKWLADAEEGSNDFCPNAPIFEELGHAGTA